MALGSAFLLYGPVGGWSRTLFLLAHELPQEVRSSLYDMDLLSHFLFLVSSSVHIKGEKRDKEGEINTFVYIISKPAAGISFLQ